MMGCRKRKPLEQTLGSMTWSKATKTGARSFGIPSPASCAVRKSSFQRCSGGLSRKTSKSVIWIPSSGPEARTTPLCGLSTLSHF